MAGVIHRITMPIVVLMVATAAQVTALTLHTHVHHTVVTAMIA
jgi:hypothetical protein